MHDITLSWPELQSVRTAKNIFSFHHETADGYLVIFTDRYLTWRCFISGKEALEFEENFKAASFPISLSNISDDSGKCLVCGKSFYGETISCATCESRHHKDCWDYNGGCAIYGCSTKSATVQPILDSSGRVQIETQGYEYDCSEYYYVPADTHTDERIQRIEQQVVEIGWQVSAFLKTQDDRIVQEYRQLVAMAKNCLPIVYPCFVVSILIIIAPLVKTLIMFEMKPW